MLTSFPSKQNCCLETSTYKRVIMVPVDLIPEHVLLIDTPEPDAICQQAHTGTHSTDETSQVHFHSSHAVVVHHVQAVSTDCKNYCRSKTTRPITFPACISWNTCIYFIQRICRGKFITGSSLTSVSFSIFSVLICALTMPLAAKSRHSIASFLVPTKSDPAYTDSRVSIALAK